MSTPPPPHTGNPYAQPQGGNPFAQSPPPHPQDGNPYAQGQPQPQPGPGFQGTPPPSPYFNQGGPGGPGGFPPPAPQRPRRSKKQIISFLVPAIGLVVAGVSWLAGGFGDTAAESAKVGECIQNKGSDSDPDIKIVDCTDSAAQAKVLKKVKDTTLGNLSCQSVDGWNGAYYFQKVGGDSFVLCLGDPK
ncbi:hypothetical protein GCM10027168_04930 [Streptomyces capparidis]